MCSSQRCTGIGSREECSIVLSTCIHALLCSVAWSGKQTAFAIQYDAMSECLKHS
jgi:hypothetical protein